MDCVAHWAPPSMEFSRQEYWSGVPLPSPGDLSDAGVEPKSPALQADALLSEPPGACMSCLYILEINPLSVVSFATIFSHSEGCLFTLLIVSFAVQKLLSLIRSHLYPIVHCSTIYNSKNMEAT